jgi:hypothetical protein
MVMSWFDREEGGLERDPASRVDTVCVFKYLLRDHYRVIDST